MFGSKDLSVKQVIRVPVAERPAQSSLFRKSPTDESRPPPPAAQSFETVLGVTVLGDELFLLLNRPKIQLLVYSVSGTGTASDFSLVQTLSIPAGSQPEDITSCAKNRAIYISDSSSLVVHKFQFAPSGSPAYSSWPVTGNRASAYVVPYGLSVTSFSSNNVLVACGGHDWRIREFNPSNGRLVRDINFQPTVTTSVRHCVQISADEYVICHGTPGDSVQSVLRIGKDGLARKAYSGKSGFLSSPHHVAVDQSGKAVYVTDCGNCRAIRLSTDKLEEAEGARVPRSTAGAKTGGGNGKYVFPYKLCLDVSKRQLFVAEYSELFDGQVTVYAL